MKSLSDLVDDYVVGVEKFNYGMAEARCDMALMEIGVADNRKEVASYPNPIIVRGLAQAVEGMKTIYTKMPGPSPPVYSPEINDCCRVDDIVGKVITDTRKMIDDMEKYMETTRVKRMTFEEAATSAGKIRSMTTRRNNFEKLVLNVEEKRRLFQQQRAADF